MSKLNFINRALLSIVMLPAALYRKSGANTQQVRSILLYKLMMDDRRPSGLQLSKTRADKAPISGSSFRTVFVSAIMGCFYVFPFFITNDALTTFTIYYTMFIVMLALTLITDFTSVLIDVRDNFIILPKPVSDASFVIARILHITAHVLKIMLPMSVPGLIATGIKYGWLSTIPFLAMVFPAVAFTIFLINAIYLLVLKLSTPEKFKSILSYIQIGFVILVYGSYQILPRMVSSVIDASSIIGYHPLLLVVPPYWFAATMQQLILTKNELVVWIAMALSLLMPVIGMIAVVRFFAPTFNQKLSMIASGSVADTPGKKHNSRWSKQSYSQWLSTIISRNRLERHAFLFSWKMMLRNRDFKLKVYPGFGYIIVIIVASMLRSKSNTNLFELLRLDSPHASSMAVLAVLYLPGLTSMGAYAQTLYTENSKAGWIFHTSALQQPGRLIAGSAKAVLAQLQMPMLLLFSIVLFIINGWVMVPHILLAFFNLALMLTVTVLLGNRHLPWTMPVNKSNQGTTVIKTLLNMLLLVVLAGVHALLIKLPYGIWMILPISILACWFCFKSITNLRWHQVQLQEQ
ncbi:MAG TPA: hypothetical protein VLC98_05235 [Phnomibacter sp.]|nr:hypothetical protein [Phnomibacter sp.]